MSTGSAGFPTRAIDRASAIPFYYQLQEILKEEIESGRWPPGETIPSEAELASLFDISRTVIRKALDILEADGQVYRVKGRGTIVAEPKFRYAAVLSADSRTRPTTHASPTLARILDLRAATVGARIGNLLELPSSALAVEVTYLHNVGNTPASVGQTFLRMDASQALARVCRTALPTFQEGGPDLITQLSERYGVLVVEAELTIESTRANDFESNLLNISTGDPTFLMASRDVRTDGAPIAFTRAVVPGNHFHFAILVRRQPGARKPLESLPFIAQDTAIPSTPAVVELSNQP
jgi:GntR family transcriptional regulator